MRFLKRQTINHRQLKATTLFSDVDDANVYINPRNSGSVVLPSGTDAQIPGSPINGMMRYNVDHGEVQVYQSNAWRSLRFKESTQITQQNLGAGNAEEVYFGPLNPAPPSLVQNGATWGGQNLLVVVENVLQLHGQNYTVEENPTLGSESYTDVLSAQANTGATTLYFNTALACTGASGDNVNVTLTFNAKPTTPFAIGSQIIVTGFSPAGYNGTYTVTACTATSVTYANTTTATMTVAGQATSSLAIYPSTNFTGSTVTGDAGLQANTTVVSIQTDGDTDALISMVIDKPVTGNILENTSLTITESASTGTGKYLKFSSPVPYGKIVTVLHGFDQ